ncbi:MAG: Uncharacterized protein Greene041619_4 [Candidatus Peregrinibacteria bacterium Greene0416_19]|nr:MAG: Uncharacterized protein Greene041619_4 [Candidatus Peregrinibacteria bacterium Greene0416_19]
MAVQGVTAARRGWQWIVGQQRILGWRRFGVRVAGILGSLVLLYMGFLWLTLPNLQDPVSLFAAQSTVISDRNGVELYRLFSEQDRTVVTGEQISTHVRNAVVAIEDARFYDRGCIDMRALARVVLLLGRRGGASTLTRQLARNALNLQQENIVSRKLKELILGCQLEWQYSKEELLTLYLNWIPFGQNAYGVEQASKRFFGESAKDLTLAQSAVLASLPQLPSYYSPYGRHVRTAVSEKVLDAIRDGTITSAADLPDREVRIGLLGTMIGSGSTSIYVGGRTDQVLQNMLDQGYITAENRDQALKEITTMAFKQARESIRAPYFVLWIKDQVEQMFEQTADKGLLERGGLTIETTLDWRLQKAAEKAVGDRKEMWVKLYGAHNMALVAMDPKTREILAYVGNVDYTDTEHGGKVDMVLAPRQPGSSFKPFVYASAFTRGFSPATVLYDVRTKFGPDQPDNYDGTFWGLTNARKALGGSRNIPAIKAYFLGGEEDAILALAAKMGAPTPLTEREELRKRRGQYDYGWPLALGAGETPLLEMVGGYSTFANGGRVKQVASIRKITRNGVLLPTPFDTDLDDAGEEVLDPRVAYQITSVLSDVSARPGEFWQNSLTVPGFAAAAKTGTSNKECPEEEEKKGKCRIKPANVWTIGYTPVVSAGVWVGNANSTPLSERADGLSVAAPIWKQFMIEAHKILKAPATPFPVPEGIVQPIISQLSGELPTECTPVEFRKPDVFLRENAPNKPDPACMKVMVDRVTGLLASETCPEEARELRSFFVSRSEIPTRFPDWEQAVQAWAAGLKGGTGALATHFTLSPPPAEKCDPALTPGRLQKPTIAIENPADGGAVPYPSFQPRFVYSVGSGVREVEIMIDGKVVAREVDPVLARSSGAVLPRRPLRTDWVNKIVIRVPRSVEKTGEHELSVKLTDVYFNTATHFVTFRFGEDSSAPSVRLRQPADGTAVQAGTDLVIAAEATDPEGAIRYVEFYLDALLLSRSPKEPYSITFPLTTITPGPHVIRAVATDLAGQAGEDSVEIVVEP